VAPREGHMKRLRRICGYLACFSDGCIRIQMEKPDYSGLPEYGQDWARSVYGNIKEALPKNCPEPRGKSVCTTTHKDANLYHDLSMGRAVTGVLHFINKMPINWYSRKQSTVETATYGSEFSSAKTVIQQIQGLRTTLRYLGVPVDDTSYMFGDNGSIVMSSTMPDSQLNCRHLALSYHYVREAIASGMVAFYHMPGEINSSDVLSKLGTHGTLGRGSKRYCSGKATPRSYSTKCLPRMMGSCSSSRHYLRRKGSDKISVRQAVSRDSVHEWEQTVEIQNADLK
jgi:hypothetical protein